MSSCVQFLSRRLDYIGRSHRQIFGEQINCLECWKFFLRRLHIAIKKTRNANEDDDNDDQIKNHQF